MSIHVCKCIHKGQEEFHLRYPGLSEAQAQSIADKINGGALVQATWKPIETAPKDGTEVDVFAGGQRYTNAWYRDWIWHSYVEGETEGISPDPTHWMRIPKNPPQN